MYKLNKSSVGDSTPRKFNGSSVAAFSKKGVNKGLVYVLAGVAAFGFTSVTSSYGLWSKGTEFGADASTIAVSNDVGFSVTHGDNTRNAVNSSNMNTFVDNYNIKSFANQLESDSSFATYFSVSRYSSGNSYFDYTVQLPSSVGSWFNASNVSVKKVESVSDCRVDSSAPTIAVKNADDSSWINPNTNEAVSSLNISGRTPAREVVVDNYCIVANVVEIPGDGTYSSTATVTTKEGATDSDTVEIPIYSDPGNEPDFIFITDPNLVKV